MHGMNKDKLCLLPHDPAWKEDFLREKSRIVELLKDDSVQIEHIGSTSIPTVHAKPILDIAILCGTGGLEPVTDVLVKLGYDYRGQFDERDGHYYAVLDRDNIRLCQAHIYTAANEDWQIKLLFRDVLSENLALAQEYNEYKLQLAKVAVNKNEYAEIKTRWVDTFILKVIKAKQQ